MKKIIFSIVIVLLAVRSSAQVTVPGNYHDDYVALMNLKNYSEISSIGIFPAITNFYVQRDSLEWNVWGENYKIEDFNEKSVNFSNISLISGVNYTMPWSYNDGPIWSGKGNNLALAAGVNFVSKNLVIRLNPIFNYSQNRPFEIREVVGDKSEFSYPLAYRIDYVQRYGDDALVKLFPGQSELRFIHNNWTIGASTQNMTWGPSQRNPIIMSKQGAGFPHVDLGTYTPLVTKLGTIEVKSYWGILSESNYFDSVSENDKNLFGGLVLGYRPSFMRSLSVGVNRSFYRDMEGAELQDAFAQFVTFNRRLDTQIDSNRVSNDFFDQMVSIFAKWTFPREGFEVYMEFAKNDFPGNFLEFVRYPDRGRAYTIGFSKLVDIGDQNVLKVGYEGTVLGANQVKQVTGPGNPTYYIHNVNLKGYTHDGQLLGAGIGPGSNSNWVGFHLYTPKSRFGLEAERIRFNDDHLVRVFGGQNPAPAEYQLNYIASAVHHLDKFSFQGRLIYSRHSNWYADDERGGETLNFQINLDYRF